MKAWLVKLAAPQHQQYKSHFIMRSIDKYVKIVHYIVMRLQQLYLRELFHLVFLQHIVARLKGRPYAVKGGACLRFFHQSPRLSEDLDLDVATIPVATLRTNVQRTLTSAALKSKLYASGIEEVSIREAKQTATTQRWKVQLRLQGGTTLSTRIEWSRRQTTLPRQTQGIPDREILARYQLIPFVCSYYDGVEMIAQKIHALAAERRAASRDLFDLHQLLMQGGMDAAVITKQFPSRLRQMACAKIDMFSLRDFNAEVTPFLPADLAEFYQQASTCDRLKKEVHQILIGSKA